MEKTLILAVAILGLMFSPAATAQSVSDGPSERAVSVRAAFAAHRMCGCRLISKLPGGACEMVIARFGSADVEYAVDVAEGRVTARIGEISTTSHLVSTGGCRIEPPSGHAFDDKASF